MRGSKMNVVMPDDAPVPDLPDYLQAQSMPPELMGGGEPPMPFWYADNTLQDLLKIMNKTIRYLLPFLALISAYLMIILNGYTQGFPPPNGPIYFLVFSLLIIFCIPLIIIAYIYIFICRKISKPAKGCCNLRELFKEIDLISKNRDWYWQKIV